MYFLVLLQLKKKKMEIKRMTTKQTQDGNFSRKTNDVQMFRDDREHNRREIGVPLHVKTSEMR